MAILLYNQQKCYLNLVIKKLKHYFKDMIHIFVCRNLEELRLYDNQMIGVIIIDDINIEIVHQLKIVHNESDIIFAGKDYDHFQEFNKIGIKDYLIMPIEIDALCESVVNTVMLNKRWCLSMKDNGIKHVFELDEVKYAVKYYDNFFIMTIANECFLASIKSYHYLKHLFFNYFMQVNQSVMINMQYIDYSWNYQIILQSCEDFQVSNRYMDNIMLMRFKE
ncbi:MAG: hypothetical protein LUF02_05290 [Erysipelotrichaceae bacterium]|nr:hypothetical protein [Erysipelotrichaceae bacterium]